MSPRYKNVLRQLNFVFFDFFFVGFFDFLIDLVFFLPGIQLFGLLQGDSMYENTK
jgi:hypothetical protein